MAMSKEELETIMSAVTGTMSQMLKDMLQSQITEAKQNSIEMTKAIAAMQAMPRSPEHGDQTNHPKKTEGHQVIDAKAYMRMDKFDGGESRWLDWKQDFIVITGASNARFAALLPGVEANSIPLTEASYAEHEIFADWREHAKQRSKELLGVLFQLVTGEAKAIIKDFDDGLNAWRALCKAYSRRTLARTLRLYRAAQGG